MLLAGWEMLLGDDGSEKNIAAADSKKWNLVHKGDISLQIDMIPLVEVQDGIVFSNISQ
jgi:hypothetical protein